MKISFTNVAKIHNMFTPVQKQQQSLAPLGFDTVSFSAQKKAPEEIEAERKIAKANHQEAIKDKDAKQILEHFGIKVEESENCNGNLTISHYQQPEGFTFEELGVDENELVEDVEKIEGKADFRNSKATNLDKLQIIGGDAIFYESLVENLGNLEVIGGNAIFAKSKVTNLDKLCTIGGSANFYGALMTNLDSLWNIVGDAVFCNSKITSLKNLTTIVGNADFSDTQIKELESLRYVDRNLNIANSLLTPESIKKVVVEGEIIK